MIFERTKQLIGSENLKRLQQKKVAIFGLGGVGSYVFEGLIRSGIGSLVLVDKDEVDVTNINRQLVAYHSTIGMPKVEVCRQRAADINPDCQITGYHLFYLADTKDLVDLSEVDYIVDAMDNVTAKIMLIKESKRLDIPIISCLGTGNKLDNTKFVITDISNTMNCPLAKVVRRELNRQGIKDVPVLYSKEQPVTRSKTPASIAFVPSVAGLMIAGEVVHCFLGEEPYHDA